MLFVSRATAPALLVSVIATFPVSQEREATITITSNPTLLRNVQIADNRLDGRLASRATISRSGSDGRVLIRVPCDTAEYVVNTDALVSAPVRVTADACDEPIAAEMFLRAGLRGTIDVRKGIERPSSVAVNVRRCSGGGASNTAVGVYRTTLSAAGAWSVPVPADCLDIVVSARALAPETLPRMALARGQVIDLGRLTLRPGASLVIAVEDGGGRPVEGAVVSVTDAESYAAAIEQLIKEGRLSAMPQVMTGRDGLAQVTGIAPGPSYVLSQAPGRMGISGPVELEPGTEKIQRVTLRKSADVTIQVVGERDWLDTGAKLVVLATPQIVDRWIPGAYLREEVDAATGRAGMRLPVDGLWRFELYEELSNQGRPVARQEMTVDGRGPNAVVLDVYRMNYRARVTLNGIPQTGSVVMIPKGRAVFGVVRAKTDRNGEFTVPLPEPGLYVVEFTADDGQITASRTSAEFTTPDVVAEIALPNTSVGGLVLHEDGTPAAGASVTARAAQLDDPETLGTLEASATADTYGRFRLRALAEGDWELRAVSDSQASDPTLITVGANPLGEMRLVLKNLSVVFGRIVTDRGVPVPGAAGTLFSEVTGPGEVPRVVQFHTDLQGHFRVTLDRPGEYVQVQVFAPGRPLAAFRIPRTKELFTLTLPAAGGELRLVLPKSTGTPSGIPGDLNLYVLVNEHGALIPYAQVLGAQFASVLPRPKSATIVISSLSPGTWRVCKFTDMRAAMLYLAGRWPLPVIEQVRVDPGRTVEITVKDH